MDEAKLLFAYRGFKSSLRYLTDKYSQRESEWENCYLPDSTGMVRRKGMVWNSPDDSVAYC